jgi:hypothetical protein
MKRVRTDKIGNILEPEKARYKRKVTIISIIFKLYIALLNQERFSFYSFDLLLVVLTHISNYISAMGNEILLSVLNKILFLLCQTIIPGLTNI